MIEQRLEAQIAYRTLLRSGKADLLTHVEHRPEQGGHNLYQKGYTLEGLCFRDALRGTVLILIFPGGTTRPAMVCVSRNLKFFAGRFYFGKWVQKELDARIACLNLASR